MPPIKLYGAGSRMLKCELAAAFASVEVEKPPFTFGVTNKTPWFLEMNPNGKIPLLQTPTGSVFESHAISKYLVAIGSDAGLYPTPSSPEDLSRAHVDQWVDWANVLDESAPGWLYVLWGMRPYDKAAYEVCQAKFETNMSILEAHLTGKTWMVGDRVTLADIVVAMNVFNYYILIMDEEIRSKYPNVVRHAASIYSHPVTMTLFGMEVKPCTVRSEPNPAGGPGWAADANPMAP
eukprot:gene16395-22597_t